LSKDMVNGKRLLEDAEKYRDLFENANDLIQSVDIEGRYLYVNRAWKETLGYNQSEIENLSMFDVIHPDNLEHCRVVFGRVMSGEVINNVEATFLTKDGRKIDVEGNVNCAFENGKPGATRSIFRDITQQKRTQEKLDKLRRDFTSMIVHDLRSPMNSIKGFTELLVSEALGPISEKQHMACGIMKEAIDKQLMLINDYLDVSKLESGQIDIEFQRVDVSKPISQAIRLLEVQAELKDIGINLKIKSKLPLVFGDESNIEQVLLNLLTNAMKFTEKGGSIIVSVNESQDGDFIQVSVSDTGVGIAAGELSFIFDKYRQVSTGKVSGQKGTGLGLTICKLIVGAHKGKIWVESEVGKGSIFHFTIPAAR
jgi:PAS domain S-box-containing protein